MWGILRIYSYIFETILCAMGLLLAGFSLASRHVDVQVGWLPGTLATSPPWIGLLAIVGFITVVLAATRISRLPFFLFAAAALYILMRGLFVNSQYTFSGAGDARNAVILVCGALVAFVGAIPIGTNRRLRRY